MVDLVREDSVQWFESSFLWSKKFNFVQRKVYFLFLVFERQVLGIWNVMFVGNVFICLGVLSYIGQFNNEIQSVGFGLYSISVFLQGWRLRLDIWVIYYVFM